MAEKEVQVKLRLRTDTAAKWLKANPVLLSGEIGIEGDTGKMKVGDGKTKWRVLPYLITGMSQKEILDCFFPVDSVKITATNANPGDTVGGVWEQTTAEDTALFIWVRKA